jgi:hypothetical protein
MTAKQYVKQYYPDAYYEKYEIWSGGIFDVIIGEGSNRPEAWADAQLWIDGLPEDQKPKIK